jgi:ribosomal protein L19
MEITDRDMYSAVLEDEETTYLVKENTSSSQGYNFEVLEKSTFGDQIPTKYSVEVSESAAENIENYEGVIHSVLERSGLKQRDTVQNFQNPEITELMEV